MYTGWLWEMSVWRVILGHSVSQRCLVIYVYVSIEPLVFNPAVVIHLRTVVVCLAAVEEKKTRQTYCKGIQKIKESSMQQQQQQQEKGQKHTSSSSLEGSRVRVQCFH